jgi:hypothetical protein
MDRKKNRNGYRRVIGRLAEAKSQAAGNRKPILKVDSTAMSPRNDSRTTLGPRTSFMVGLFQYRLSPITTPEFERTLNVRKRVTKRKTPTGISVLGRLIILGLVVLFPPLATWMKN